MSERKPASGDNSWLGVTVTTCQLQIIDEETNKWKTVGVCIDAPNALKKELEDPKYQGLSLWKRSWTGRTPLF